MSDDVVVVTGAARGIGAATARSLVADGMRVGLFDVDADGLNALKRELGNSAVVAGASGERCRTFITAQSVLPYLVESAGYLLFVTSMSGLVQGPFQAAYNASKAAVHALANTMRQEVSTVGVDVGVIYLNAVDTERAQWALSHPLMEPLFSKRAIKPASVEGAAAAIVKAITRRSRTVTYPWKGPVGLYTLPLTQRVTDRWVTRQLRR